MYIDFHKFNYNLIHKEERESYIKRDQEAYKQILSKWLEDDMEQIVQRKWEIKNLSTIKDTSDFFKLLKEAETLYELGFYTSCIALIGVAAEDFSKYIALKVGKSEWK